MDPLTATIVTGLIQQAGGAIFAVAQRYTMRRLGLDSSQSVSSDIKPLLDDYLQQLRGRLDEDRIAKLYGAFSKLMDAPRSVVKQGLLIDALDKFHEVSQIPQQGITGDQSNAQLRCMAFVGMAASYMMLQDQPILIAEKMVEAVQADTDTAKQWLGDNLVREIVSKLPPPTIICPKCGFQNPAGSQFCNRDGYPLNLGQGPSLQQSSQTSTLQLIRLPKYTGSLAALKINLDGKKIGTIRNGETYTLDIQTGNHIIFLSMGWLSSPPLSFTITSGEKVTLLCQIKSGWISSILLWKQ